MISFIPGRFEGDFRHNRFEQEDEEFDRPHGIGAAPSRAAPVDVNLTGDEAYQRRLAMSAGIQRPTSPKDVPLAPSFTSAAKSTVSAPIYEDGDDDVPSFDTPSLSALPTAAETGEEAYLRRLAMSQSQSQVIPREAAKTPEPSALAYNPFAPSAFVPPPSAAGLPASGTAL